MTREARGKHVDFPSMESALITISLLLFAVYLIKLVMVSMEIDFVLIRSFRLIQKKKTSYQMPAPSRECHRIVQFLTDTPADRFFIVFF